MPLKQQYVNAIVLSASGDALGWMTEFYSDSKQLAKKFGTSQITKFLNWERFCGNRYNGYKDIISSGSYSDDTQLMLAVARSINIEGKCDHQHFAKIELVGWLDYKRGAGMATTEAAQKIQRKSASWNNNFYIKKQNNIIINYSNAGGNGAAMRVLPISLAFIHNLELTLEEIFCNSIVTHGHPRAIIGAMLYGLIINTIINLKLNGIELLIYIGQNMQAVLLRVLDNILRRGVLTSWFKIWEQNGKNFDSEYRLVIQDCLNILRNGYTVIKNNKDLYHLFELMGVFNPDFKGSGVSTVIAALFCFCKIKNYYDGIIYAVNLLGADTDSIAGFLGAMYGVFMQDDITDNFIGVQDFNYLVLVAENLFNIADKNHITKSIYVNTNYKVELLHENLYQHVSLGYGEVINSDIILTNTKNLVINRKNVNFFIGQSAVIINRLNEVQ